MISVMIGQGAADRMPIQTPIVHRNAGNPQDVGPGNSPRPL